MKRCGGIAVVQDPDNAITPDMPTSARDYVDVDHCASASRLGSLPGRLAGEEIAVVSEPCSDLDPLKREVNIMHDE